MMRLLLPLVAALGTISCRGAAEGPVPSNGPAAAPAADRDPGRVTLRRLNRNEYDNTVRDLLGTSQRPAGEFPSDDLGYGFDNVADVLSVSPLHLEMYTRSAELLVGEALRPPLDKKTSRFEAEALGSTVGQAYKGSAWLLWSNGEIAAQVTVPAAGSYTLRARAWAQQAGPEIARVTLAIDGGNKTFDITANEATPQIVEHTLKLTAGPKTFTVAFVNDFYEMVTGADRNLFIDFMELEGPLEAPIANPLRARIVTCPLEQEGDACAERILRAFTRRAWRRPPTDAEIARLMKVVATGKAEGEPPDAALGLALQAVLTSPHFVFRVELDPDPSSGAPHALNAHEVATRLSYFLWSTMPDDALFAAADAGKLTGAAELKTEIARMLADPKAQALVDNFAGQWLHTRKLEDHEPDYNTFPMFTRALAEDMRQETHLMVRDFLAGKEGMDRLLSSDAAYLTDRLARHYGLPAVGGNEPRRTSVAGSLRGGILGQGSFLTVTSYPTRTAPVQRGRWVLEQLLCTPPPPPPPGVEGLKPEMMPTGSLRVRLEQHRANPTCAACHQLMDPIGFGLETFDGVGVARTRDGAFPIDTSGAMPDGRTFAGAKELAALLAADPRFPRCIAEKIGTYALGRSFHGEPGTLDAQILDRVTEAFVKSGYQLPVLITELATSEPFLKRRGEPAGGRP